MKSVLMITLTLLTICSCAGSASHKVLTVYEQNDVGLDCRQIDVEIAKAQDVVDAVNMDKKDVSDKDVIDGILWFPFNLIAKNSNYDEALAAADARIERLRALKDDKNCNSSPRPTQEEVVQLGSGWIVSPRCVATNNHVIESASSFHLISSDGQQVNANLAISDPVNDLAILTTDSFQFTAPPIPVATRPAKPGASVFTIGYPHPSVMGARPKISNGIVSAATGLRDDPRTYQISVPLQSGNSGGPILNMSGNVIGLATSKLNAAALFQWTGDLPENVNYAIKVQYLIPLIQALQPRCTVFEGSSPAASLEELNKKIAPSVVIVVAR